MASRSSHSWQRKALWLLQNPGITWLADCPCEPVYQASLAL